MLFICCISSRVPIIVEMTVFEGKQITLQIQNGFSSLNLFLLWVTACTAYNTLAYKASYSFGSLQMETLKFRI